MGYGAGGGQMVMKKENQEGEEACQAYSGPSIQLSDVQCKVQGPQAGSLGHMRRV